MVNDGVFYFLLAAKIVIFCDFTYKNGFLKVR